MLMVFPLHTSTIKVLLRPVESGQLRPDYRKKLESALRDGLRSIHRDTAEERDQLKRNLFSRGFR